MKTSARSGVLALLLLSLASAAVAAPAGLETQVDAAEVDWGQSVVLRLRLRGSLTANEPDLTPLKSAFEVLDVSRSQRQSLVNGSYDASSDWTITLLPKSTGTLEIPALTVGPLRSEPQSIRVLAAGQAKPRPHAEAFSGPTSAPVFVRVAAERSDPYEQERVLLRVRIYSGPELIEGAIDDPTIEGAIVERLGEDRSFEEEVSGRAYRGVERTYALLPEAPGRLVVPPIAFEGVLRATRPAPKRRRSGFFGRSMLDDFFSNGPFADDFFASFLDRRRRRVVVRSEPLTLDVRPRPEASKSAWWLPARAVSLTERWEPEPKRVRVGQVLTRRITLRAQGAGASQLPALVSADQEGVKQYAEAPETSENQAGSTRVQEITVIPTQPGRLELPPIEVAWWDTTTDTPRVASLDARSIEVQPGAAGGPSAAPPSAVPAQAASAAEAPPQSAAPVPGRAIPVALPWMAGLGLAGLIAAAAWLRRSRRRAGGPPAGRRAAERALRRACRRSDPVAAEQALRRVLRARNPGRARIDAEQWAREVGGEELAHEVAQLQSVRYSTSHVDWQGKRLWAAYRSTRKRRKGSGRGPRGGLPPLYPAPGSRGSPHEAS